MDRQGNLDFKIMLQTKGRQRNGNLKVAEAGFLLNIYHGANGPFPVTPVRYARKRKNDDYPIHYAEGIYTTP